MAIVPAPGTGALSPPPPGASKEQQLQIYAADFEGEFGGQTGTAYLDYAEVHPSLTPKQAAQAFATEIAVGGLDKAVSDAIQGVSAFTQAAASGSATAANSLAKDTLGGFNLSGWFLRIGEILVGLVLAGIGLNAMLKGKPLQIVTGAAGTVGKAAIL